MAEKISSFEDVNDLPQKGEVTELSGETHRGLKSRHVQLIALGGCIGTGLFIGSGQQLANSGPASLLISYILISFVIWCMVMVLAEMTVWLPLSGVSPTQFVRRYADTSLSFATGWNYWYAYSFLVASETVAVSLIIPYWTTKVHPAVWITIALVVVYALNVFFVKMFGEAEFWFASIKIIAIVMLIIVGFVIFFGGAPDHDRKGFRYWTKDQAFQEYLQDGSAGRLCGFWFSMIKGLFSFIMSPELLCVCAGETEAPRRNIPKAANRFVYRLVFFYVIGSFIIGVTVSSKSKQLLSSTGGSTASASPFVIAIQSAGIGVLNHIINAAILTSAWSAGSSFLYAGSRTLYSLALGGEAPRFFKRCNRWGVPFYAVTATALPSLLGYLTVSSSSAQVFNWFVNISTISGTISWLSVLIAWFQFRKALKFNGIEDTRQFKAPLQPYSAYFTFFLVALLTITNGFAVFVHEKGKPYSFSASDFVAAYITIPLFFILYFGHKIYTRNWRWLRHVPSIDITTGLDEAERIERMYPDRVPKNWVQRVWFWIA